MKVEKMEAGAAARFPGLMMKRFELPEGCSISSFVMRELTGRDEAEASIMVERSTAKVQKDNAVALFTAERREQARLALVEVDGRPVNHDGAPFTAMDNWSQRTMIYVLDAFDGLNSVTKDELEKFRAAAVPVSSAGANHR